MRPGADLELYVGRRETELLEEDVGHVSVVVLARVHEHALVPSVPPDRAEDGCDLHEVRPGSHDEKDTAHRATMLTKLIRCTDDRHGTERRRVGRHCSRALS